MEVVKPPVRTPGWEQRAGSSAGMMGPRDEEDLYTRLKSVQRQLEFVEIQEEYIKDEQKNLKRELLRAQEEVKRIQSVPLVIGQFLEMVDGGTTASSGPPQGPTTTCGS